MNHMANPNKQLTKANSTKAQRRAQALANQRKKLANSIPRPVARVAKADPAEHYRHCVLGPVAMPATNLGYPDGDTRPSVTFDFRKVYVMKPNSGRISFGIATSAFGAFIKGEGALTTDSTVQAVELDATTGGFVSGGNGTSFTNSHRGVVPITSVSSTEGNFGGYRPLVAVCEVHFTGSTMQNGGSVTICKALTPNPLKGDTGTNTRRQLYEAEVVQPILSATSVTGPARHSYTSRIVPPHPDYVPISFSGVSAVAQSVNDYGNAVLSSNNTTNFKVCSLPSPDASAIWYMYEGLDTTASITVSLRYCVQYSVNVTSAGVYLAPLARPSPPPPPSQSILSKVFEKVSASPAALTFLANTVGYLAPQTRPILSIAAAAYNSPV